MSKVDKDTTQGERDEYDLRNMPVRRVGLGRTKFGGVLVGSRPDVAVFPNGASVNATLELPIKRDEKSTPPQTVV